MNFITHLKSQALVVRSEVMNPAEWKLMLFWQSGRHSQAEHMVAAYVTAH